MRRVWLLVSAMFALSALAGCHGPLFLVNLVAVDEKTALERQVLGNYQELGRDLTVYASMRGVEPDGSMKEPPKMTESQSAVLQAFSNRKYNHDDVNALLSSGVVGEGNDGTLVWRSDDLSASTELTPALAREIVDEENRDRLTILQRLIKTTPGVTDGNRSQVTTIFAELNQELAPDGSPIQKHDGTWSKK